MGGARTVKRGGDTQGDRGETKWDELRASLDSHFAGVRAKAEASWPSPGQAATANQPAGSCEATTPTASPP